MTKRVDSKPVQTAVIYARYSSHAQRDVSIEQQVEECREYAERNNMTVTHVYADRHISGRSDRRPEFQRMMRDAGLKRFQVVIAYKSNRISRKMLQALSYEERLAGMGVTLVYVKEEFGNNAAGRFALRMMMNMNEFYSDNMAEDIKRGMTDNAEKAMVNTGMMPIGFKKGTDGRYAINEDTAPIVREIYRRYAADEMIADIARDLNSRKITTAQGKEWRQHSFNTLLRNESYVGVYHWDDIRIEGGTPQLIDRALWEKVQQKLTTKKATKGRKRDNSEYLLTGKLFCGYCKSPMTGYSGTSKTGRLHHYYVCQQRRLEKSCEKKAVTRETAENVVASAIREYVLRDDVIAWIADATVQYAKKLKEQSRVTALEDQLSAAKKAEANIVAAIEQGIFTMATKDRLLELEREQEDIRRQITLEQSLQIDINRDQVIFWLESFRDRDVTNKRFQSTLFDTFLKAVYIYDDHLSIFFSYTKSKDGIDVSLTSDQEQALDNPPGDSSSKVVLAPPNTHQTNPATLYIVDDAFLLVAYL
ncbi:MAG: recombinase family protein [Eubacteriales bacterium]|nr:recombinase family protein [Eubacteriales bacterium]MDD4105999.1 recombinase family protein [Eubacteriales bacterium]